METTATTLTITNYRNLIAARDALEPETAEWNAAQEILNKMLTDAIQNKQTWAAYIALDDIEILSSRCEMCDEERRLRGLLSANGFDYLLELL